MTDKRWVAGTIMAHNQEGKYVFLVKNEEVGHSFLMTPIADEKTGLACIIETLKENIEVKSCDLELFELTNAVVQGDRIPLFVFELSNKDISFDLMNNSENAAFSWQSSEELTKTLADWHISGVPQFK